MNDTFHFIYGSDEFFVELKAQKILESLPETALECIDGHINNVNELKKFLDASLESIRTIDFFSLEKCVWLKNTNLLGTGSPAFSESGQKELDRWMTAIEKLPKGVTLILSAYPVDKRSRFFKHLSKLGKVEEIAEDKQAFYLEHLLKKLSAQRGIAFEKTAAELLFKKLNYKPRMIANEIEKLACWSNFQGTISENIILEFTSSLPSEHFFEPIEAFYSNDLEWTLRSFRNHFLQHKEVRSILSTLQSRNRLLLQLAALKAENPQVQNGITKHSFEECKQTYEQTFGVLEEKSSFCLFTQNFWYLSHLRSHFRLEALLQLQSLFAETFDALLQEPKHALPILENMARKALSMSKA